MDKKASNELVGFLLVHCLFAILISIGSSGLFLAFLLNPLSMMMLLTFALIEAIPNKAGDYVDKKKTVTIKEIEYQDMSEEELKQVLPNETLASLKKKLYDRFVTIQKARSDSNYSKLQEMCTYNTYNFFTSQLELYAKKRIDLKMDGFEKLDIKILEARKRNAVVEVKALIDVKYFDYCTDLEDKIVVKGDRKIKVKNRHLALFVEEKRKQTNCPNCGAPIKNKDEEKCAYCDTVIRDGNEYILLNLSNTI